MKFANKGLGALGVMALALGGGSAIGQPAGTPPARMPADTPILLGEPFVVDGVTFTPADPASYDEVGFAAATGGGSKDGRTAGDETYLPAAIAGAHRTLPLPSYVEVTALASGRTILIRVNDRGPMRKDRLIALTPGAMAQLGVEGADLVPVRVRRVNPPEQERVALRAGGRAAERLETPPALLTALRGRLPTEGAGGKPVAMPRTTAPVAKSRPVLATAKRPKPGVDFPTGEEGAPRKTALSSSSPPKPVALTTTAAPTKPPAPKALQPKPVPTTPAAPKPAPAAKGGYLAQVGAYSTKARADAAAARVGGRVVANGAGLWRVRLGPYPTREAAQAGIGAAAAKGFENAQIMANDAP